MDYSWADRGGGGEIGGIMTQATMYYVTWDDGHEGRIRTELPRDAQTAIKCGQGLEESGAEEVKIILCRSECLIPLWRVGDPGFYYFSKK